MLAPGITNVIYMQQAGNVQLTTSAANPNTGTLSMNNALDTTLYDADVPYRKIGKASTNNFLDGPSNNTIWFSPAPQGMLLGFNTSANVHMFLSLSGPLYNFTTNTVGFNFTLTNATSLTASARAAPCIWRQCASPGAQHAHVCRAERL